MDKNRSTTTEEIFTAEAIAKSGTAYSRIFPMKMTAGNVSLQIEVTGDGTAKFEWIGSNTDGAEATDCIKPNNANDIVAAFTKTDGPGGDGKHIYSFNISLVGSMAIKVTETGGVSAIAVTANIAVQ